MKDQKDEPIFYENENVKDELDHKRKLLISKIEHASLNDINKILSVIDEIIKSDNK